MLQNCIDYLASHGFSAYSRLDINKPEEGGIKFFTLKERVQELMEELGTCCNDLGSAFKTEQMNPPEEEKRPEKSLLIPGTPVQQNCTIHPKSLKFDETPAKRNPPTENDSPSQKSSPLSNRSVIVPHALANSGSASQISVMESYLVGKLRSHPDLLFQFTSAVEAKEKADRAQADAKRTYEEMKRQLAALIEADSDDDVSDFVIKRRQLDNSHK